MRGAVLYGARDVRFEERADPKIEKPTDAIIRMSATCVCGSDLWPYRGIQAVTQATPFGHEYCGIVEEVGGAVRSIEPGQFVIGSFFASDNTCPICRAGYQTSCVHCAGRHSVGKIWTFLGTDEAGDVNATFVTCSRAASSTALSPLATCGTSSAVLPTWPKRGVLELAPA